jgi:transcriptional antiterminator NusG
VKEYKIGQIVPFEYQRTIVGEPLDKPTWFALNTPPQREHIAREMLKAKGIHACYPERERTWTIRGKHVTRKYPVVSQIVYAKFKHQPHWDVLKRRRIITGVVSWGTVPIAIPKDTIAAVMGLPTEAEKIEQARRELLMVREAEQAVITEGPFAGAVVDVRTIKGGIAWFEMLTGVKGSARVDTLERYVARDD